MRLYGRNIGPRALFTILLVSALTATVLAEPDFTVETMTITVYRDGLTHIEQTLTVDELLPEIDVPLLASSVENLIILDENQLAVDYQTNPANLTVFTLGAAIVTIEYDTIILTSKEADLWTLKFNNPYNLTLFLPKNSTVVYLNQVPNTINMTGDGLSLSLNPGQWEISYVVPLQQETQNTPFPIVYLVAAILVASVIIITVLLVVFRKRKINVKKILSRYPNLMSEDIAVIEFLAEKDGKAFEAEIREKFPDMPRTSLWRLVRRLEGLEIVEVKKIGLENQVQLKK